MRVEYNTTILDIVYDESGQPFSIRYKSSPTATGALYYYVLNAQGDVVGLLNSSGELVVEYKYDPWGKLLETIIGVDETDSKYAAYNNMGLRNPLRYRGYIYDRDTGLYYLQSRYYDPAIGRFINADTYTTTDADGLLSTNMFAYCENNPVMGVDPTGEWVHLAIGAAIGAAVNVATSYINHRIAGEKYTLEEATIDAISGAASGALAASGVGLLGQVVSNGTISGITYMARCDVTKTKMSTSELMKSIAVGAVSGFIGGKGADGNRLIGVYNTSKQVLKTAVSPKKISLYQGKISKCKTDAFKSAARSILASIFSNSYDNAQKQVFN